MTGLGEDTAGSPTPDELMTVAAARRLRSGQSCFVGIGLPSLAAIVAQRTHAPDLFLVYESGTLGVHPAYLPLSVADSVLAETATALVAVPEMFNYWLQPGRIDVGLLGAAQVDRFGNLGSTVIGGTYDTPRLRLPGAGGAPEIAAACGEVLVIVRQSTRTFVRQVDFVSTVGHGTGPGDRARLGLRGRGPAAVVTDLGVYEPDPETLELTLVALQPGSTVEAARAATGWELAVSTRLGAIDPPSDLELATLRALEAGGAGGGD